MSDYISNSIVNTQTQFFFLSCIMIDIKYLCLIVNHVFSASNRHHAKAIL